MRPVAHEAFREIALKANETQQALSEAGPPNAGSGVSQFGRVVRGMAGAHCPPETQGRHLLVLAMAGARRGRRTAGGSLGRPGRRPGPKAAAADMAAPARAGRRVAERRREGFLPGPDAQVGALLDLPGLAAAVASPRYLLTMKVFASGVDRDVDDLRKLYHVSKFLSLDEALAHVAELYGSGPTASRSEYVGARR